MSLEICLGRNKTGKTHYLNSLIKNYEIEKALYIPATIDPKKCIEKNSSFIDPIQLMIINFLNSIFSTIINHKNIVNQDKIKTDYFANLVKMKKNIQEISKNDIFFDKQFIDGLNIIEKNELSKLELFEPIKWFSLGIDNLENNNSSKKEKAYISSSVNYSLLKLVSEILKWLKTDHNLWDLSLTKNFILIIDEVEKFSHPELIQKTADEILSISEIINVVISTHSPQLVERIMNKHKNIYLKNTITLSYHYFNKNMNQFEKDKYEPKKIELAILTKLNYRELRIITDCLFSTNVILVEGLSDKDFIESLRMKFFQEKYILVIDCNSRGGVEQTYKILKELKLLGSNFINTLLFYDRDVVEGKNNEWKEPKNLIVIDKRLVKEIVQVPDLECTFFTCEPQQQIIKKNHKPKFKYEIISKNNQKKWVKKKDLLVTYDNIESISTKKDVVKLMRKIGKEINEWAK